MTHFEAYNQIINFRKSNPLPKDQYGEKHHIVPKSICPLLKDSPDNVVRLSAQEHFLAHYHLWKAYRDELNEKKWALKMGYAFRRMKQQLLRCDDVEAMAKLYEEVRKTFVKDQSESQKGRRNPNAIEAMRKARLGSHQTDAAKEANRKAHIGNNHWLGKNHSTETRKKISRVRTGLHWYNNGIKNIQAKECPDGFRRGMLH